jgi:hypothetical protein
MSVKWIIIFAIIGGCWINLMADGDIWLAVFALIVFIVSGTYWEMTHWRPNGEET